MCGGGFHLNPRVIVTRSISTEDSWFIPQRGATTILALLGMMSCLTDFSMADDATCVSAPARFCVGAARRVLSAFFLVASLMLLLASVVECPWLVQAYLCQALGGAPLGLGRALAESALRLNARGLHAAAAAFLPDVAYYFALYSSLPMLNSYRKTLELNNEL